MHRARRLQCLQHVRNLLPVHERDARRRSRFERIDRPVHMARARSRSTRGLARNVRPAHALLRIHRPLARIQRRLLQFIRRLVVLLRSRPHRLRNRTRHRLHAGLFRWTLNVLATCSPLHAPRFIGLRRRLQRRLRLLPHRETFRNRLRPRRDRTRRLGPAGLPGRLHVLRRIRHDVPRRSLRRRPHVRPAPVLTRNPVRNQIARDDIRAQPLLIARPLRIVHRLLRRIVLRLDWQIVRQRRVILVLQGFERFRVLKLAHRRLNGLRRCVGCLQNGNLFFQIPSSGLDVPLHLPDRPRRLRVLLLQTARIGEIPPHVADCQLVLRRLVQQIRARVRQLVPRHRVLIQPPLLVFPALPREPHPGRRVNVDLAQLHRILLGNLARGIAHIHHRSPGLRVPMHRAHDRRRVDGIALRITLDAFLPVRRDLCHRAGILHHLQVARRRLLLLRIRRLGLPVRIALLQGTLALHLLLRRRLLPLGIPDAVLGDRGIQPRRLLIGHPIWPADGPHRRQLFQPGRMLIIRLPRHRIRAESRVKLVRRHRARRWLCHRRVLVFGLLLRFFGVRPCHKIKGLGRQPDEVTSRRQSKSRGEERSASCAGAPRHPAWARARRSPSGPSSRK